MTDIDSNDSSRRRGRLLGFVAGAAFMCVTSAAVGAGAATLITSAQIKDETIVSTDVKNGALSGADLKDHSLTGKDVKKSSVTGRHVKNGSLGAADLSKATRAALMNGLIPSGTTVTGTAYFDSSSAIDADFGFSVHLPGRAPAPLTGNDVNFANALAQSNISDVDGVGDCNGSALGPTAPPGQVCLYLVAVTSDAISIEGTETYTRPSDTDFAVRWGDQGSGADVFLVAVWAYTAP